MAQRPYGTKAPTLGTSTPYQARRERVNFVATNAAAFAHRLHHTSSRLVMFRVADEGARARDGEPKFLAHARALHALHALHARMPDGSVDLDEDGGDVVLATAIVRKVDELAHGDLLTRGDDRTHVLVLEVAMEAVAAEKEAVALVQLHKTRVDLDVVAIADRPSDDVAVGRTLRLLRSDEPLLDLPRDQRVIFGKLFDCAAASTIDAAVTDLGGDREVAQDEQGAHGRAHAALAAVHLRHGENHVGGCLNRAFHHSEGSADHRLVGRALKVSKARNATLDHAVDGLDGFLARDLAGGMTAHPIANDVKAEAVVEEVRVFVRLPLSSNVGQTEARALEPARRLRSVDGGLAGARGLHVRHQSIPYSLRAYVKSANLRFRRPHLLFLPRFLRRTSRFFRRVEPHETPGFR